MEYDNSGEDEAQRQNRERIVAEEQAFFSVPDTPEKKLKQKMIALGMSTIFDLSDGLCTSILKRITRLQNMPNLHETHHLDRLRYLFVRNFDENIKQIEKEFSVSISAHSSEIKVKGDAENVLLAVRAINGLLTLLNKGEMITEQNLHYVFSLYHII